MVLKTTTIMNLALSLYRFFPSLMRLGSWNILTFLSYEQIKLLIHPDAPKYHLRQREQY